MLEVLGYVALIQGAYAAADRRYKESLAICLESSTQQGFTAYTIEGWPSWQRRKGGRNAPRGCVEQARPGCGSLLAL